MLHEQDLCYKWEMLVMAINIAVNINFKAFQLYMSWTGVNNMIVLTQYAHFKKTYL